MSRCHYGKAQTSSAQMAWNTPGSRGLQGLHFMQSRVQGSPMKKVADALLMLPWPSAPCGIAQWKTTAQNMMSSGR